MSKKNELAAYKPPQHVSIFSDITAFENAQRMAKAICQSDLVPAQYQGEKGISNCLIAMDLANRSGMSPMMVMQNTDIIGGKPALRSNFLSAIVNESGRFTEIEYEYEELGKQKLSRQYWTGPKGQREQRTEERTIENARCRAKAKRIGSNEYLFGPWITVEMAFREGWYSRPGSKWPTMTEIMLHYRAVSFWVRRHWASAALGIRSRDEVIDMVEPETEEAAVEILNSTINNPEPEPEPAKENIDDSAPPENAEPATSGQPAKEEEELI